MASSEGESFRHDSVPTPNSSSSDSFESSGCPVMRNKRGTTMSSANESEAGGRFWSGWFSSPSVEQNTTAVQTTAISECAVKGPSSSLPSSIEEAANHSQLPVPGQRIPLSTQRAVSSIPRGDALETVDANENNATTNPSGPNSKVPAHQPVNSSHWTYPSEQQFYNAMRKKGYQPPVETIPFVLKIHNSVNERSWLEVRKWEKELHGNDNPKLVKFVGRPKDLSPKAWWNSRVLMTQEPFDRHDWYVEDNEKEGGEPRRYVIDFYEGKEDSSQTGLRRGILGSRTDGEGASSVMKPPSMYIDVRPALDTPSAAVDRMAMALREALPGITSVWDSYKNSSASANTGVTASFAKENCEGNQVGRKD
mmetsp:Transcript_21570/g.44294  ORF Transcript_21570/g.44294 Transcript_21570/m.44294 type:complete len:365 (+) Transcript_21570:63-1157(+)